MAVLQVYLLPQTADAIIPTPVLAVSNLTLASAITLQLDSGNLFTTFIQVQYWYKYIFYVEYVTVLAGFSCVYGLEMVKTLTGT
jgi:hypothetical protein